jgi:hypothetical protein
MKKNAAQPVAPIWCVVANVRETIPTGPGAAEIRRGTRKFHADAKVYLGSAFWGTGAENVTVVGYYRGKMYITCSIQTRYLTNWHAELVYSPAVITRLLKLNAIYPGDSFRWDGSAESKARAEEAAKSFDGFSNAMHDERTVAHEASQKRETE